MVKTNQKECISIKFSEGLGIFDDHYGYPEIDKQEINNGPTGKVRDIQGIQAHAGRDFFVPEGKEFSFDIDDCPYLHIAVKAEKDTKTCLFLMVHDKEPDDHKNRFVVIGKTPEGDPGIYDIIKDCFEIKDDGQWHEYDLDLRKIREKQDGDYPYYPDAGSVCIIQFYSWTGSGEHTFHFNELLSAAGISEEANSFPLIVDEQKPFLVYGQVSHADSPLEGFLVKAFDKDLRSEEMLGESKTDNEGNYRIIYDAQKFSRAEKGNADLIFKLFDQNEHRLSSISAKDKSGPLRTLIAKNEAGEAINIPVLFNAPQEAAVDLIVNEDLDIFPSEYEQLLKEIAPLLDGLSPAELKEDDEQQDITFLAGETGRDPQRIRFLAQAILLMEKTDLKAEVFYGLFRQDLPMELPALLARGRENWKTALIQSFDQNIIPRRFKPDLDDFLNSLHSLRINDAFKEPEEPGRSSLSSLLGTAIPSESIRSFLDKYYAHEGLIEDFWTKKVPEEMKWEDVQIKKVQTTLQFATITGYHLPLVKRLQQREGINSPKDMTRLDRTEWLDLVKVDKRVDVPPDVPGKDDTEKADNYVDGIIGVLHASFPTQYAAQIIEKTIDPQIGTVKNSLSAFFEKSTNFQDEDSNFDFRTTHINSYLEKHAATVFDGLSEQDRTAATVQLKRMQRAFQMSSGPEQMKVLLEEKFDSAHQITRFSKNIFIEKMGAKLGGEDLAAKVYDKADHISATVQNLFVDIWALKKDVTPLAMSSKLLENKISPTYAELFKNLEMCDCEHCRSMYSPAAYFVDILHFLDPDHQPVPKPIDALFARRPDLAHIPLTCENTNTPIPYVDLVNEILESWVALNGDLNKMEVRDTGKTTSEELSANPQYINDEAYRKLKDSVYPFTLPYNQPVEVARTYLEHMGSSRMELMETFNKKTGDFSSMAAIASEYLHISSQELEILTGYLFSWDEIPGNDSARLIDFLSRNYQIVWIKTATINKIDDGKTISVTSGKNFLSLSLNNDKTEVNIIIDDGRADEFIVKAEKGKLNVNQKLYKFYGFEKETRSDETAWVDDDIPTGATPVANNIDTWNWITTNHKSGTRAHLSAISAGQHQHYFENATQLLPVEKGNFLFAYIYIDPANPPDEVMLQWKEAGSWEHRAYWGGNHIEWGENGKESHRLIGDIPSSSKWIRLEVPGSYVGLEGKQINGMAFTLFGGSATWDLAGKRTSSWQDELTGVPEFLQRSGINYIDLVELVKTKFINPNQEIILQAPDGSCDLSVTSIRYTGGGVVDDSTLDKMHRFIRLWNKLGWTISELDMVLAGLGTTDIDIDFVINLAASKRLEDDLKLPLPQLLSLWTNIDTYGDDSLYQKLFLSKAAQKLDDKFELTSDGSELKAAGPTLTIKEHIPAILAAFRISEKDLEMILEDTKLATDTAPLNLGNLSALYRYTVLAKALRITIIDLITLKSLAGIDPFRSINGINNPDQTIRFIEMVRNVQMSGFTVAQLNYLYRHIQEPPAEPLKEKILELAKNLREGLTRIMEDNTTSPDSSGELTRIKLGLIFEPSIADQTIRMIDGSAVYSVPLDTLPAQIAQLNKANKVVGIDPEKFPDAVKNRISYKIAAEKTAKNVLLFTGAMATNEQTALLGLSPDSEYQKAIKNLFQQPRTFIEDTFSGFMDTKDQTLKGPKNILLETASLDSDGKPVIIPKNGKPVDTVIAVKFAFFLEKFLPYLHDRLSHSLIKQTIGDALKIDPSMAELLLEKVLKSQADSSKHAIYDFLEISTPGLTASYFNTNDLTGTPPPRTVLALAFDGMGTIPETSIPVGTGSARWTGLLNAPNNGDFTFSVRSDGSVQLWIGNNAQPLALQLDSSTNEFVSGPIPLKAGESYDLHLEITKITLPKEHNSAMAQLYWQSATIPKTLIPSDKFYPRTVLNNMTSAYTLIQKAATIVNNFKLTNIELSYLSDYSKDFAGFDLNGLPLTGESVIKIDPVAQFMAWQRLFNFTTLRNSLPQNDVSLIDVFKAASDRKKPNALKEATEKLIAATGWDSAALMFLISPKGFGFSADDLVNEKVLIRLQECMNLSRRLGMSAETLSGWANKEPDSEQAQSIKNTVKARYDDQTWLTVAKSLNDGLRESQKSALISYLLVDPKLKQKGITNSNGLYEYFLIDVDMSTCFSTSRIKQAISSVQLFIQRCLMNLEPEVSLSLEEAKEWHEWRKQYRIWEANRKVFLYPENWIEPELRDDKSPFFKELESELLQNEVTEDNVEKAFLNYLYKLDQVARLEICGMCWQDNDPDTGEEVNILHVFGRTMQGIPHIYYYRRLENTTWTPWEKVQVDIEGDHLIPVIWNRRLYLFWPIFTEKARYQNPITDWEIKLAYSEYKQNRWSPKQIGTEVIMSQTPPKIEFHFFQWRLSESGLIIEVFRRYGRLEWSATRIVMQEYYDSLGQFYFTGCQGLSLVNIKQHSIPFFSLKMPQNSYNDFMSFESVSNATSLVLPKVNNSTLDVLHALKGIYKLMPSRQFEGFNVHAPFFYQDDLKTYFVTIREQSFVVSKPPFQFNGIEIQPPYVTKSPIIAKPDHGDPSPIKPIGRLGKMSAGLSEAVQTAELRTASLKTSSITMGYAAFYKNPWAGDPILSSDKSRTTIYLQFHTFFHPYICAFIKSLNRDGISELFKIDNQKLGEFEVKDDLKTLFKISYDPTSNVDTPYPREDVDFSNMGAYSLYNWELFFHAPMMLATRLSKNNRFEAAQRLFHYIYNPTDNTPKNPDETPTAHVWNFQLFRKTEAARIQDLLDVLGSKVNSPEKDTIIKQINEWKKDPFNPHLIARMRPGAYMKNVLMKYIDNLIAWGDQLFRQDTIESINEATQLYVLAAEILGPRPQRVPKRGTTKPQTYEKLRPNLDALSNALSDFETEIPFSNIAASESIESDGRRGLFKSFYFCIPQNDNLLGYWDTVADRLFKIRHCMNIEGVVRELPLYEPPIDPALLVQARAMGIDISSIMNDINAPTPYYRFNYMLQKALELCADLKSLGVALLSALEKRNAEELSAIRAGHETVILNMVKEVKNRQLLDAQAAKEALSKSRVVTEERHSFYMNIEHRSATEMEQLGQLKTAQIFQALSQGSDLLGAALGLIPDATIGVDIPGPGGSVSATFGGSNFAEVAQLTSRAFSFISSIYTYEANMASIIGGWERRSNDWKLQERLAAKELEQIDKQIMSADIRIEIAKQELKNHDKQIENAQKIEEFLRTKYTNQDLYIWMQNEVLAIYNQCYQMAFDLARKAEKCFRFERGVTNSNFIKFGYWDSAKKGLLAGEQLYLALKQMETAYMEQNRREYEITKNVSLLLHDPMALISLKSTGHCEVVLPEGLFDADYPGHYMRRIKSVNLTIPCVVGPYTSINCTLTLLSNKTRTKSIVGSQYSEKLDDGDDRFVTNFAAMQSIATSHAQNDSGMFELNFRDERYLPFEGAGVISRWRIDLPKECNAFDFDTISDVIIKMNYTAREGGDILRKQAMDEVINVSPQENLLRMFSVRHEFPKEWYNFLNPTDQGATIQTLQLDLMQERFPFQLRCKNIQISKVELFLMIKDSSIYTENDSPYAKADPLHISITMVSETGGTVEVKRNPKLAGLPYAVMDLADQPKNIGSWKLEANEDNISHIAEKLRRLVGVHHRLNPDSLDDLVIVIHYSAK